MDPLVERARDRGLSRPERALAVSRLTELVLAHLEEEDRSVVPLLAGTSRPRSSWAAWHAAAPRSRRADEARVLAMMLAAANEARASPDARPGCPTPSPRPGPSREAPALHQVHRVMADVSGRHPSRNAPLSARPEEQEIR